MIDTFRSDDWNEYRMEYGNPHKLLEPIEREIAVVDGALKALVKAGIIPTTQYDKTKMIAHREAVREMFEIPWTAITPRMQRLIYAVNAITKPKRMIAAGVFCGNTFISNAGAGVGPGKCYDAEELIGIEIRPEEAERAERNVRRIDPSGVARVVAADAIGYTAHYPHDINLLYLDADGDRVRGKGIYLEILEAGLHRLPKGAVVMAHNSITSKKVQDYLAFARNPENFASSVNVIFDIEGLEVSIR
ncbi:MAG TPA: hypothetical protein PL033_13330 [Candidatus Brocadiia bacterium]|nr:hypothetical protein [Candidatus Brocadiia bacterium]